MNFFMKKMLSLIAFITFFAAAPAFSAEASLDEMIGQMIILGFKGNSTLSKGFREVSNDLKKGKISGVIFFETILKKKEHLDKILKI